MPRSGVTAQQRADLFVGELPDHIRVDVELRGPQDLQTAMFRTLYELPINRGNDKTASNRAKHIGSNVAKELRERIKPYFLRRMKNVVSLETGLTDDKQLPKKNELIIWLKLTDCQRQLYKAFLNSELVHLASQGNPLAALTVLKKICDHPLILTKRAAEDILEGMDGMSNNQDMLMAENMAMNLADMAHADDALQAGQEVSCKLSFIMSLLRNLLEEGHHILIFSQTRKMLNLIQEAILLEGYNFLRMDGTTETSERERIVKDFKDGLGAQIFLLTTKVGGLGLTLTKAARVIVVDPAWNPRTFESFLVCQNKGLMFPSRRNNCKKSMDSSWTCKTFAFVPLVLMTSHSDSLRDESLREHIQFLEKQGIAGVSHHSLLFSKTEVLPMLSENDALDRGAPAKPKDERFTARTHLASNTDSEIPEEINRLLETLASTTLESRLVPDCRDKTHDLDNEMLTMWFLVCKGRDELLAATEAIC
uniref:DNA excision repair protein ERCC-6-like protein n=1 Tax=Aegilops tauschii TaxID=37682 RepID=M8B4J0_AEGTA